MEDIRAKDIITRFDKLRADRQSFYDSAWRSSAEWLMPRKSSIWGQEKTAGESGWVDNIFDTTAMQANERLAAWLMTSTSPANSRWFAFTSSAKLRAKLGIDTSAADQWWQSVTAITLEQLAVSNFYTEKHEAVLDRNTFGTCAMLTQKGKTRGPLNFRNMEVASYVIASNDEGYVDTVMREFKLTARQAVQQFGLANVGKQVLESYNSESGKRRDKQFHFIHSVHPNVERNPQFADAQNKEFASCYVCREDECVVQESGYDELPYAVSRFLKWVGDDWGWAPAFTALPVIRETNFFKMQMNALAELAAFPPVLEPDTLAGQIDMRAGGRTVYDANQPDAVPKPLYGAVGSFDIGKDLLEQNRVFIKDAFYNDVVAMFSNMEREITAFEAAQLASEKLDVFSPYYHRLITELDTPTLQRVFAILLEGGFYPEPPQEVIEVSQDGSSAIIDLPEVTYLSRLALAIQAHEIGSFDALVARAVQLSQIDPSLGAQFMSNYDLDRASRGLGRNLGVPVNWQKTPEELQAEREAQAQAAQQQATAEAVPGVAKAVKDIDSVSPSTRNRLAAMAGAN